MEKSELPIPFMGRMILEIISEDAVKYINKKRGLSEDNFLAKAGFEVVSGEIDEATGELKAKLNSSMKVPYQKGRIVSMASDAFGEAFTKRYGTDFTKPTLGDTVLFVRNQSYVVDVEEKYHIIDDQHIIAFYKGKENEHS